MTICETCRAIGGLHYAWCPKAQPAPTYSTSTNTPAAEPPGETDGLREQIARWLHENTAWTPYTWEQKSEQSRDEWRADADDLLDVPAVRALLDDAARVRRVRAVRTHHLTNDGEPLATVVYAADLVAALRGDGGR